MSFVLRNIASRAAARSGGYVTPAMREQRSFISTVNNTTLRCSNKGAGLDKAAVPPPTPATDAASLRSAYRPNRFEQRMLVWTKKYKSLADVPTHVNPEVMEYSRNKMRIRVANYMAIATIIGCIVMIYSGKKAAKRGEFVAKKNLDWHNQYNQVTEEGGKKN